MSREEDLVRTTLGAIADTVADVPPLRLEPAPDELRSGWSRWRPWLAPLGAAALVLAVVLVPVIQRGIQGGSTAAPQAGAAGLPPYYVALADSSAGTHHVALSRYNPDSLVVGETLTGKTLATVPAPKNTTFVSVSAAADDRTFAVLAYAVPQRGTTAEVTLYELKIAPGSARPVRLTRLPVTLSSYIFAMAISSSGRDLALATYNYSVATHAVERLVVYSIPGGRLLHSWSSSTGVFSSLGSASYPLTWVDGDRAIAFLYTYFSTYSAESKLVSVDVRAPAGNVLTESQTFWVPPGAENNCYNLLYASTGASTGAKSEIVCGIRTRPSGPPAAGTPWTLTWTVYPLGSAGRGQRTTVDDSFTVRTSGAVMNSFWASPSGTTVLVDWYTSAPGIHYGLVSGGKFTPLPSPPAGVVLTPGSMGL